MAHIEGSINNKGHKQMDERNICLQEHYSTNFLINQYENSTKVPGHIRHIFCAILPYYSCN